MCTLTADGQSTDQDCPQRPHTILLPCERGINKQRLNIHSILFRNTKRTLGDVYRVFTIVTGLAATQYTTNQAPASLSPLQTPSIYIVLTVLLIVRLFSALAECQIRIYTYGL